MSDEITLEWHGPLMLGNIPDAEADLTALNISAVYMFFRCYDGLKGKSLVYVGKAGNFAERLAMHYGDFLSTKVGTLYRDDGSVFRHGGLPEYFRSLQQNLDETLRYAVADARRTRFVYAPVPEKTRLGEIEATMIKRLRCLPTDSYERWNTTCQQELVQDCAIHHDRSKLVIDRLSPEELDRLLMVLSACQNG